MRLLSTAGGGGVDRRAPVSGRGPHAARVEKRPTLARPSRCARWDPTDRGAVSGPAETVPSLPHLPPPFHSVGRIESASANGRCSVSGPQKTRRRRDWRALRGADKEVFFSQERPPGTGRASGARLHVLQRTRGDGRRPGLATPAVRVCARVQQHPPSVGVDDSLFCGLVFPASPAWPQLCNMRSDLRFIKCHQDRVGVVAHVEHGLADAFADALLRFIVERSTSYAASSGASAEFPGGFAKPSGGIAKCQPRTLRLR